MPGFRLNPVQYIKPDGIDSEYFMLDKTLTDGSPILVVSFTGSCPDGSAGSKHAAYVSYAAMCGLHAFSPWAIVLDFRNLDYRWGNSMYGVFQDISRFMDADIDPGAPPFPIISVISDRSVGFTSLLLPSNDEQSNTLIHDINTGIESAIRAAKEWIDA